MTKGYYTIFNNISSDEYTEQEKLHSIKDILSLVTHNSINKQSIIKAFRWFYDYCLEEAKTPQTNADRIRNMTDEELAEHILSTPAYETCIKFCKNREECCAIMDMDNDIPEEWCKQCLLEWLQKEVG